ncbi:GIY-YIG nuclease family protein [Methylocella sp.]|uniref:GIY-YIG nuclease family protein n=1 Tax=Methylocella sp. TaxID=1978226 RepID=UPI0035AEBD06
MTELVYFLDDGAGRIKIGVSGRLTARIRQLSTGNPGMTLMCVIPGGGDLEKEIHKRFAAYRLGGEWFRAAEELLAFIAAVGWPVGSWDEITELGVNEMRAISVAASGLRDFLRAVHPRSTAFYVAARTGQPVRTVEKWIDGSSRPNFEGLVALLRAYGRPLAETLISSQQTKRADLPRKFDGPA